MDTNKNKLNKSLGLFDIVLFGVGGIVGAGIYAIIGEAAGMAGNMLWAAFMIAAVVALLTGLCYAEFVSRYPDAGGSFEYIKRGFGPKLALSLSIVIFLTSVIAPAAIAISFSGYLSALVDIPQWISTVAIILLMAFINIFGVRNSSWFNILATVITLLGLGSVVVFSIPSWGDHDLLQLGDAGAVGLFSGAAIIFFSYVGFEDLVKLAEETKDARRNMPKGIIISGIIVLVLYVVIAISAVSVMEAKQLLQSSGPLAAVMEKSAGQTWSTILVAVALFATSKTIMANIMSSGRLVFDVARDNDIDFLNKMARVHQGSGTPRIAIGAAALVTLVFGLIGNLKVVASISNVFIFFLFLMVNIALIRLRLSNKDLEKPPYMMPLNVGGVSVLSFVSIIGILVLLGFNLYNIFA
ncbi:MAG: amino acid permease [Cyclobacteriaceae bacterium]|nr:amino acid permease [Cyclobacteriaceae bacterium]